MLIDVDAFKKVDQKLVRHKLINMNVSLWIFVQEPSERFVNVDILVTKDIGNYFAQTLLTICLGLSD